MKPRVVMIDVCKQPVPVHVTFRNGDRLSISVHPDLRVTAVAPIARPWDAVKARIQAKTAWIDRQRQTFARYLPAPAPRRYVSGETYHYLGRQYRLRISTADEDRVFVRGGTLCVECRVRGSAGELVQRWYRSRAEQVLADRFAKCTVKVRSTGLVPAGLMVREMKRRWGSCTKARRILLNPALVRTPTRCIDYVIIHELCHLHVMRHDDRFLRMVARLMPDWRERKARLDRLPLPLR